MAGFEPIKKHLFPIHVINWIFGIGIVEYPPGRQHPVYSLVYSLVCLTIYCTIALTHYQELIGSSAVPSIHLPIKILFFSQIFITISTMVLGWYRNEDLHECVINASLVDYLMEKIGLDSNPKRLFKVQVLNMIPSSVQVLFMMVTSSAVVLAKDFSLSKKLLQGIAMNYPVVILYIADLTFTNIVRKVFNPLTFYEKSTSQSLKNIFFSLDSCVNYRFEELNSFLENMIPDVTKYFEYSLIKPMNDIRILNLQIVNPTQRNHVRTIEKVRQIHLQLKKLCQHADRMYGLQILMSIIVAFAILIGHMYMIYVILVDVHITRDEMFKVITAAFIWCSYYIVKMLKFSSVCSYCVQQSIKTGDIINKLYDHTNPETQREIREFNVQLIQSPLKFTAYGFVDLDYTLIQGMIASITTYLMILIQLGKLPLVTELKRNSAKIFDNRTINSN